MKSKRKGVVFLLVGCLLLLVAGGWYAYNLAEDASAGRQAQELLHKLDAQPPDTNETGSAPVVVIDGDAFCGKVIIDKLSVELPVYAEWSYARLKAAPCRYTGGVDSDDMIVAAHNYKSHFGSLGTLAIGDEVRFVDGGGRVHRYEVREVTTLDGTAVSDMRSGGWNFTLFTCTKGGEQRVTVRCVRM